MIIYGLSGQDEHVCTWAVEPVHNPFFTEINISHIVQAPLSLSQSLSNIRFICPVIVGILRHWWVSSKGCLHVFVSLRKQDENLVINMKCLSTEHWQGKKKPNYILLQKSKIKILYLQFVFYISRLQLKSFRLRLLVHVSEELLTTIHGWALVWVG